MAEPTPPAPPAAAPNKTTVDGDTGGHLVIRVTRGRKLAVADRFMRSSDPYVVVYYGETEVGRTSVQKRTLNPEWGDAPIYAPTAGAPAHKPHKRVVLEVLDQDRGADDASARPRGSATLSGDPSLRTGPR